MIKSEVILQPCRSPVILLSLLALPTQSLLSNRFVCGNMILVNPSKPKKSFYLLFCNRTVRKITPSYSPHSTPVLPKFMSPRLWPGETKNLFSAVALFCTFQLNLKENPPLFCSCHRVNRAWIVNMQVYFKNCDFLVFLHLWTPIVPPDVWRKKHCCLGSCCLSTSLSSCPSSAAKSHWFQLGLHLWDGWTNKLWD